jgi:uncharacterized protein (DUF736 family)
MEYAKQGSKEIIEGMRQEEEKLQDWSRMACVSFEVRTKMKVKLLFEFSDIEQRSPKEKESYKGVNIGYLWKNVKLGRITSLLMEIIQHPVLKNEYEKYLRYLDTKKDVPILSLEECVQVLLEFVELYRREPKSNEEFKGVKIGRLWHSFKQGSQQRYLSVRKKILENDILKRAYETFLKNREQKISTNERADILIEFVLLFGRIPKKNEMYKGINISMFWNDVKRATTKSVLSKLLEIDILKQDYEKYLESKKNLITPEQRATLLLEFVLLEKRMPTYKEVYKGVCVGTFWNHLKQGGSPLLLKKLLENEIIKANYDIYLEKKKQVTRI